MTVSQQIWNLDKVIETKKQETENVEFESTIIKMKNCYDELTSRIKMAK